MCDFAVGLSRQLYGLTIASERPEHKLQEAYHPLGVIGVITAFNFPNAVWAWNAMLAAVWDTPYNVVYLVHLLSIVLGVGMAFLAPVLTVRARREGNEVVMAFVDSAASAVVFPALLVTGTAGGALVGQDGATPPMATRNPRHGSMAAGSPHLVGQLLAALRSLS